MSARIYTGQQVAALVGLSWQHFRRVRQKWTTDRDFPAELNEHNEVVRYLAEPVDRWLERRSRRIMVQEASRPRPQVPVSSGGHDNGLGRRGRAALTLIMGG